MQEYNSGQFYGSKVAIGIFDAPGEPLESDSKATAPRTPTAVVAASVTALFCLGLVLHQRRRHQNGYAPIYLSKGGSVQGKSRRRPRELQRKGRCAQLMPLVQVEATPLSRRLTSVLRSEVLYERLARFCIRQA